jgi:hypothetical protein
VAKPGAADAPPVRQAVVLRAGPPAGRRGRWRDLVLGIVGVLLLAVAGSLVNALPEKDVLMPQYRVTVIPIIESASRQQADLRSGGVDETDFTYTLPDNLMRVEVGVGFKDDVEASLRDSFEVTVYHPDGSLAISEFNVVNDEPYLDDPAAPGPAQVFVAVFANEVKAFVPYKLQPPQDTIVEALHPDETKEAVRDRLMTEWHLTTGGDYQIHVRLKSSGDCPPTGDTWRIFHCQQDPDLGEDGTDTGNPFDIQGLTYTYFLLDVQPVE